MKAITYILCLLASIASAQQVADTYYRPDILNIAYDKNAGPVVFIDEGHHNFHTKSGRYQAFSDLLERDGYRVKAYAGPFMTQRLESGQILVISNALNQININKWYLPTPSAFSKKEIETVKQWVANGGSLFLIADHMPMAGAAEDLAKVFGFEMTNGFALNSNQNGPTLFRVEDQTLIENEITAGRYVNESVSEVASFTGQAFRSPEDAKPILILPESHINILPDTAWVFEGDIKQYNAKGMHQGAYMEYGEGRIVVFGEAAMFTSQLAGPNRQRFGMSHELAKQNYQLLLNIIHWLDRGISN
ncbi:hypothetical protein [Lutimonas sp.]|uniref:hypothetical protein n=1 Tax=Lutimonas sp. TaxID=1872403 RepID=UPI003D9B1C72